MWQLACLMLDYLEEREAATKIRNAIEYVLVNKVDLTPDLGGTGTTESITNALIKAL